MNLVTVASGQFAHHAIRLINSYNCFYKERIIFCHFGDPLPNDFYNFYKSKVKFVEVPMLCEHAHNPRFYFYKTLALQVAMDFNEPFIYLDSRHKFLSQPIDAEKALEKESRFFVSYPRDNVNSPLQYCTTRKCFQAMKCYEDRYTKQALCYWAAIQAYAPTPENKTFIGEFLSHMLNVDVAGPSNWASFPEPHNPTCRCHRNDQSCLSILIEKYNYQQPFNDDINNKYGDHPQASIILGRTNS